jgi:hypothetical protein
VGGRVGLSLQTELVWQRVSRTGKGCAVWKSSPGWAAWNMLYERTGKRKRKAQTEEALSHFRLQVHTFWIPGGMVCHQACADAAACQKKEIFLGFLEIPRYFLRK